MAFFALYDSNSRSYVAYDWIYPTDFSAANDFAPFRVEFTATGAEHLHPGVYYYGNVGVEVDRFSIAIQ